MRHLLTERKLIFYNFLRRIFNISFPLVNFLVDHYKNKREKIQVKKKIRNIALCLPAKTTEIF